MLVKNQTDLPWGQVGRVVMASINWGLNHTVKVMFHFLSRLVEVKIINNRLPFEQFKALISVSLRKSKLAHDLICWISTKYNNLGLFEDR